MLLGQDAIRTALGRGDIVCHPMPSTIEGVHIDVHIGPWFWVPRTDIAELRLERGDPHDLYELKHASDYGNCIMIPAGPTMILAHTVQAIGSRVASIQPDLDGRSTLARWGLTAHISAGHGDPGYCGVWTLEIQNCHNVVKYLPVGARVGSVRFTTVEGNNTLYCGRYNTEGWEWEPDRMLPRVGNW